MPRPAQSGLSLPSRHSFFAVWIIHSSILIELYDYPILLSSAVSPGVPSSAWLHAIHLSHRPFFRRFSGFTLLFFLLFCAFYVWQIALFVLSIMRLVDMYHFYTYLLQIPDVRLLSICRCSSPDLFLGRYPDHLLARSRPTDRSYPQL